MNHQNAQNVFMIGWEYPPHNSGGLGVACAGLTTALSQKKSNITFTLPYQHNKTVNHMQLLACHDPAWSEPGTTQTLQPPFLAYSHTSAQSSSITEELDGFKLRALPHSELERKVNEYAIRVTAGALAGKDFGVIHAHDWMAFPAGMQLKQKTGKPLVTHVHSTEYDRAALSTGSHFITNTEFEGMQMADKVIAVSYYTKRLLIDRYGIDSHKVEVVYNGVDPLSSNPERTRSFASKRPVIAFMGRLTLQKGVEYFIAVARRVLEQIPDALFVVAGSGDMYHELLFKTAEAGVSASVLFSGFVRDTQKEKLLSRADVFLMPSVSEPFGLVAVEAAQRNIPVIVSTNAGASEVLPHAIAVDFWDVHKMADAVVSILSDETVASGITTGQQADIAKVTWDNAATRVQEVYRKAFIGAP